MTLHGRLETTPTGRDMVVARTLPVVPQEAWPWITESDRTQRWYGPWTGTPAVGEELQVTMGAEEGSPTSGMRIVACEHGRGYTLASTAPAPFDWVIEMSVEAAGEGSLVTLRHHDIPSDIALRDLGAGWEFYLQALVSAVDGSAPTSFEDCLEGYGPQYDALG